MLDESRVADVVTVGNIISMIMSPLYGVVSDATSPKTGFIIWCAIGTGMVLFPVLRPLGFLGACILVFFNKSFNSGNYFAGIAFPQLVGHEKAQILIGWAAFAASLGAAIASTISAMLFEMTGSWSTPLVGAGIFSFIGLLIAVFFVGDRGIALVKKADKKYVAGHPELTK